MRTKSEHKLRQPMIQSPHYQADNDNRARKTTLASPASSNAARLAELRDTISRLERAGAAAETELEEKTHQAPAADTNTGTNADDRISLPRGWVHELWARTPTDMQAATSLMLAADEGGDRPIIWITDRMLIREYGLPYGPGLQHLGIDPARILLVRCDTQQDSLWTLEECLKSSAPASVIGELGDIDLTASRRLTLVAREYGTRCLLLLRTHHAPSTAAYSRWHVSMATSMDNLFDPAAPGAGRLKVTLTKHRGGERPQSKILEWSHATDSVPMVTAMADGPLVSVPTIQKEAQYSTG